MKDPTPKTTRTPARDRGEHLNSPVDDGGFWPYERLADALPATVVGVDEPYDPGGYVPPYRRGKDGISDIEE